jgi:glycosyltransferase involved in cell wall biosynthesis
MKVSVLMPVYSETDLLTQSIERLKSNLGGHLHEILIVVSPKSTPECLELCHRLPREDPQIRTIVQSERPGIGWAYREAIPHMTGTHGLIISSDLETDPDDARRLVDAALATGADIVCASRWSAGGGFTGYDPVKLVLNYGYNLIFRGLYRLRIHDITFGYKLVTAEVLRSVRWEYGRHEFCAEVLLKPVRLGYRAVEVPAKWVKRPEGESKNAFLRNLKFASAAVAILFQPKRSLKNEASPG